MTRANMTGLNRLAGNLGLAGQLRDGGEEAIHVGTVVIVHEPRAHGAARIADTQRPGELPGVVVAVPDVHVAASQMRRDLGRRVARHVEVGGRGAARGLAVRGHVLHRVQRAEHVGEQPSLVVLDGRHRREDPLAAGTRRLPAEAGQVVHGGRHAGQVRVGGSPQLETFGHGIRRGGELVRAEGLQQGGVGDDRPDVRAGPLVGAGRVEVGPEGADVDRRVRGGVHTVDVGQRADGVGAGGDRRDVGPRAEDVARRRDRDQPGPLRQQPAVLRDGQLPRRYVDFGPPHPGFGPGGGLNPRAHVRVVIQAGDHDLVARPPRVRQGGGQPVGERGHVRAEDDAVRAAAHEVGDGPATAGHDGAGPLAGREGPARVADSGPDRGGDGVDDGLGHLRSGGAVQVGVSVAERGVGGANRFCVEGHATHACTFGRERALALRKGACSGRPAGSLLRPAGIPPEHPEQRLPHVALHRRDQQACGLSRPHLRHTLPPAVEHDLRVGGPVVRCGARTLCTGQLRRARANCGAHGPAARGKRAGHRRNGRQGRAWREKASAGQPGGAGEPRGGCRARRQVRRVAGGRPSGRAGIPPGRGEFRHPPDRTETAGGQPGCGADRGDALGLRGPAGRDRPPRLRRPDLPAQGDGAAGRARSHGRGRATADAPGKPPAQRHSPGATAARRIAVGTNVAHDRVNGVPGRSP